jgi:beta-1,4-mannosyl-glycoprotein beta-1,4-N-acetylglucosaminyltransferase
MLIDTFMFYNEFDVLQLRLESLDAYVDKFVLVESEVNHVGGRKELFFDKNKERYSKWLPKIVHIVVTEEESPKDPNPWSREKYQRDCILRGLVSVPDDATVMVSDVDEIPDMEKLSKITLPKVCSVHMWMFEYSLNYVFTGEPWFGTVITNCALFKHVGPNYLRDNRWKFTYMAYSGWHLSSFGDHKHVCNKMHTFAHAKDGHHESQTPELFEDYISKGLHTDGKTKLLHRTEDIPLPPASKDTLKKCGYVCK